MNVRTLRNAVVVSALALVILLTCGVLVADGRTSTAPELPRFLWGAWIGDQYTGKQPPWDWRAVTDFEHRNTGGRHINVLHWGLGTPWDHDFNYWRGALDIARNNGVLSVVDMATDNAPLRSIADGSRDGALETWASEAAAWGQPVFLRLDFEMNGNWFPWGTGKGNQNTPADFVAAWRHMHQVFTTAGATNVQWVWCPNIALHQHSGFRALYPGNSYVDWTCLDGYNFGKPWKSFTTIYQRSYKQILRIAPSKPMMIGETGSTEHGGSKASWITGMFQALSSRFRHVHALLYYDVHGVGDWPIETSRASSAAFRRGIASKLARVCRGLDGSARAQCLGNASS
jgi:hypothetical protein